MNIELRRLPNLRVLKKSLSVLKRWCRRLPVICCLSGLCFSFAQSALAHEYWIEPHSFLQEDPGRLMFEVRNGEDFEGQSLTTFPESTTGELHLAQDDQVQPFGVQSNILQDGIELKRSGLHVLSMTVPTQTIRHASLESFTDYLKADGLFQVLENYRNVDEPTGVIIEQYRRYAKALVQVGETIALDESVGLELELILKNGQLHPGESDYQRVELRYQGLPLEDVQVTVFNKQSGLVGKYRTNVEGLVDIPVVNDEIYLFGAVHMRRPTASDMLSSGAVWESLWTSLTFKTGS